MSDFSLLMNGDSVFVENESLEAVEGEKVADSSERKFKIIKIVFCILCFVLLGELIIYKYIMPVFESPKVTVNGQKNYSAEEIAIKLLPMNSTSWVDFDVEEAVRGAEDIEMCDCVSMIRDGIENGFALHIIFTDQKRQEYEEDIEKLYTRLRQLQEEIFKKTQNIDMVPTEFKIRTSFPFKQFGKRDVEAMKREEDGFIHIDKDHLTKKDGKVLKKI